MTEVGEIRVEQSPVREKLSDEEIGSLISAFGNHEAKTITLLAMRGGEIYSQGDLHRTILDAQGKNPGWRMDHVIPFQYCDRSLAQVGLVVKGLLNPLDSDSHWGFQLTDYGKNTGIPLAGLLLDWGRRHDVSLIRLWGGTQSSSSKTGVVQTAEGEELEVKKRAPITTLKIIHELVTSPHFPIREVDLANRLGETPKYLSDHLARLLNAGLIQYKAKEVNRPYSAYQLTSSLPEGELPVYRGVRTLTQAVFAVFQEHKGSYLTREGVFSFLPPELKEGRNERFLLGTISNVLSFFKKNGYVENQHFDQSTQSEINLTDDQRTILAELVEIVDRFQDQDPEIMQKGSQLAEKIINNTDDVSELLRKARKNSSYANRSPSEETTDLISSLICSHPDGLTNREMQELLDQLGKRFDPSTIRNFTAEMERAGLVRVTKQGSVKKFFPKKS